MPAFTAAVSLGHASMIARRFGVVAALISLVQEPILSELSPVNPQQNRGCTFSPRNPELLRVPPRQSSNATKSLHAAYLLASTATEDQLYADSTSLAKWAVHEKYMSTFRPSYRPSTVGGWSIRTSSAKTCMTALRMGHQLVLFHAPRGR